MGENVPQTSKIRIIKITRETTEQMCVICLGRIERKCYLNPCFHEFCFSCLLEWAETKPQCPLCKRNFKSVIHCIRSDNMYGELDVHSSKCIHSKPEELSHEFSQVWLTWHHRKYLESCMKRFLVYFEILIGTERYQADTQPIRAAVYRQHLWVKSVPRNVDCSPDYYRYHQQDFVRLVPWITRELSVFKIPNSIIMSVVGLVLTLLLKLPIESIDFYKNLVPYMRGYVDHFLHELYSFARSALEMAAFDDQANYSTNLRSHGDNKVMDVEPQEDVTTVVLYPWTFSDPPCSQSRAPLPLPKPTQLSLCQNASQSQPSTSTMPQPEIQESQSLTSCALSMLTRPSQSQLFFQLQPTTSSVFQPVDLVMCVQHNMEYTTPSGSTSFVRPPNYPYKMYRIPSQANENDPDDCVIEDCVKPQFIPSAPSTSDSNFHQENISIQQASQFSSASHPFAEWESKLHPSNLDDNLDESFIQNFKDPFGLLWDGKNSLGITIPREQIEELGQVSVRNIHENDGIQDYADEEEIMSGMVPPSPTIGEPMNRGLRAIYNSLNKVLLFNSQKRACLYNSKEEQEEEEEMLLFAPVTRGKTNKKRRKL